MDGGFDKLLLDSMYEDNSSRRQVQLRGAGYSIGYGYEMAAQNAAFDQLHDPFAMSNSIAPNVQMALMSQQEHTMVMNQHQMMLQHQHQHQQQKNMMMVPHNGYGAQYYQQPQQMVTSNPFGDPFSYPQSTFHHNGSHMLI